MLSMRSLATAVLLATTAYAHIAPWGAGMYCKNGLSNTDQPNNNEVVNPLYNLTQDGWWEGDAHASTYRFMHGQCRNFPPPAGEFLNLPAGGSFTVEMAGNRGQTTLSFGGQFTSEWPDGNQHPEYENGTWNNSCIVSPNLHAKNHDDVAGSAFAIAYKSDINQVTINDLVVFTVADHTPWKRVQQFQVPRDLPACPSGGCTCAWGWVPNNCGQPNHYMAPWKCQVTNVQSTAKPLASPQAAAWCENNAGACVKGAKKMIIWHQQEGNTVNTDGQPAQADGQARSPGAQNDIFRA
ncbi:hypothetical protein EXIGLDRAFT_795961 [Exidia glandulosa HHB12029]|uniref:Uncharacterized protein n=1 Tax=Exidia glandulosa HHB12029 TaxID=1314781 RepID=A0A165NAP3_EXIGL|nr:hypothetical protein EXIGLDRAFT_795961 [Exidia glandulosa HHB12029]